MITVQFDEVSKRYLRGGPRYRSLRTELADASRRLLSYRHEDRRLRPHGMLALEDVSFTIGAGQSYALIGPNGAGKSTALKLVARISYPTSGKVVVRGRVAALIEVGAGVHPELTGRENIWLYGQILGMSKNDIRRRFDRIVAFSELGHVLDTPVKMYSSGMQLRLGFAIASHLEPEVFVVDEALAVGDAGFQARCVDRMTQLVREGRTLLFVSHDLLAVETLCERAMLLVGGRCLEEGPARDVLHRYQNWTAEHGVGPTPIDDVVDGGLRVVRATCHDGDGVERYNFETGEPMEVRLHLRGAGRLQSPHVNLGITDGRPGLLIQCSMLHDGLAPREVGPEWQVRCMMRALPLRPRQYFVYCDVFGPHGHGALTEWRQITAFTIRGNMGAGPLAVSDKTTSGAVAVDYQWSVDTGISHP